MKTKKEIEWEASILNRKRPSYSNLNRKGSWYHIYSNDFIIEGRVIALEWVLGSWSTETRNRINKPGSILAEIELSGAVNTGLKSKKRYIKSAQKQGGNLLLTK